MTSVETFQTDVVVIGAGVVGLAVGRAMARAGHDVWVLERNGAFGQETSARNSEVIHAGIYYAPGSLKAQLCVAGRAKLYAYCAARKIAHARLGKLIVAGNENEVAALENLAARGAANGVDDLRMLTASQARDLEPALQVHAALSSPSTGIVDSHGLMLALLTDLEEAGGMLALGTPVEHGHLADDGGITLRLGGTAPCRLHARHLINAGGLHAADVTARLEGLPPPPPPAFVKGHYFSLQGRAPFSRLIYPAPRDGGLGIHLTLDLAGRARFGPDTQWLETTDPTTIDYGNDGERAAAFASAIRRYWPNLPDGALLADYTGVRPKVAGATYPDFCLQHVGQHMLLYGIESPGLTACLAIADAAELALRAGR